MNPADSQEIGFIDAAAVRSAVTMKEAIGLMENAFTGLSEGTCHVPLRSVVDSPDKETSLFFKPVFDSSLGRMAIKVLSQNEGNRKRGIPTISGIVILFESSTGRILSIMDGAYLTALRTGAVAGLASRLMSREGSDCFALFGCGAQGYSQLEAVLAVRKISKVFVYDRSRTAAERFISEMQPSTDAILKYSSDLRDLVKADIITTATGSRQPLFARTDIKPGVHINAIGGYRPEMQEIASEIIRDARVCVDQKKACLSEAGDLLIPILNGYIKPDQIQTELGDLIAGRVAGRVSDEEITVFKSVGIAAQDLYVANAVYENLRILNR
jgi:ornithine cyclodeaminase/alanine dehydrogenase-like protein (mu-crystallin family)